MKYFLLILLFAATTFTTRSQNAETAIRSIMDEQVMAWNSGNLEAFMEPYWKNDSLAFIGKSGITYGWNNTLSRYQKSYPDAAAMSKLQFTIIHIQKTGKHYRYVTGKWMLKRTAGDLSGHFTLVFKKINGRWLIISDHSS
ncbi:MAG TPA: DUF4440 domain-containing protein [Ferruginibacter sp.]|nr:DUF4440 domain-containing protein [Ferruginibacter sp.]